SFQSNIIFYDRFNREDYLPNEIFMAIKHDKNFKAFTFFSSIYRYELTSLDMDTFELRYIDLRYLKEGHYPFVCIMHLDMETYKVEHSYTGWVLSEDKLQRKLLDNLLNCKNADVMWAYARLSFFNCYRDFIFLNSLEFACIGVFC